jgi:hypothetical protein
VESLAFDMGISKYSPSKVEMEEQHSHTLFILTWIHLLIVNIQPKSFQNAEKVVEGKKFMGKASPSGKNMRTCKEPLLTLCTGELREEDLEGSAEQQTDKKAVVDKKTTQCGRRHILL